jgi:hypothetical protein
MEANPVSNTLFSSIYNSRRRIKSTNPMLLSVSHYHQNPLHYITFPFTLFFFLDHFKMCVTLCRIITAYSPLITNQSSTNVIEQSSLSLLQHSGIYCNHHLPDKCSRRKTLPNTHTFSSMGMPSNGKRICINIYHWGQISGPPSILYNGYMWLFPRGKAV